MKKLLTNSNRLCLPTGMDTSYIAMNPMLTKSSYIQRLMKLSFSLAGLVAALLSFSPMLVQAQTTVTYPQRVANYYTSFTAGTAGTFDQGSFQMGQYANAGGTKQVATFRKFRTDGSGSSTGDRAMQVGDVFVVRLSATRAFGRIGFSLLASPSATTAWTDRENNYAMSMNLDGNAGAWGNWYAKYNGGGTSAGSNNVAGQQTTYKDFTFTLTLTAPDRMNATWTDGTTTSNLYDIQLNTSNPITDYCVYLEDDWDGGANRNIYWGLGLTGQQHTLTNNGALSHGQSNNSYTVSGVMTNGLDANSASTNSLNNNLTKIGSGTVTLSGANTYVGTTTVTAGTLLLGAADRISNSSNLVMNGGTFSTGSGAGNNETMGTLAVSANSTIALGTGAHTLTFANSSGTTFTSGTILTITGWTGTNNGNSSGTAGKIFVGSGYGGLTGLQLSRIRFNISAVNYGAMQLSTGEIVPSGGQVMYYGGATGSWTGSVWGTAEGGPYTTAWTSGRHAIFNIASGNTLTCGTTSVAAITYNENITFATTGTLSFGPAGAAVAPIYIESGKLFSMIGQGISTTAGNGMIKLGAGILQGANGNAYTGGFTMNNGMFAAGGVNSMGDGGALTINGGTIAGTANRDFSNRLDLGITIGGDFTLGSSTSPAVGTSNLTFNNNTALGSSVTRTITLGGTGVYSLNGIVSGTSSNLTLAATAAGTLQLGGVNTYGGNTTINGGTLKPTVSGGLPSTTGLSFANTAGANLDLQTTALTPTIASLSGGGSTGGNIVTGAPATAAILTINQSSNTTYSGLISGSAAIVKTGSGTLTLGHTANTYTGTTTITAGELRLNPSTTTGAFASQVVLNGGKLSTTGIAASTVMTSTSTLKLDANSTIDLGSNAHDLKFANSSGVTWGAFTITINGWTGTGGSSGTAGRIFFGSANTHLTGGQLGKITFNGYPGTPILLATGELVPAVAGVTYTWDGSASSSWTNPANWTPGTSVAGPTASDNVIIPDNTYPNALVVTGSQSCYDFTVDSAPTGDGVYSIGAGASLTVGGAYVYGSSVAPTFNCTSTLTLNGTGSITVPAHAYGNLDLTGGNRVLASSGTIGICGTFTRGAGAYTVTGSTVDYNGSGAQTISAGTYNNLTISNARGSANLTSPAGTISVAGTFDVSTLSAYTPVVNSASIFDFTGSGQTVPAFFYGQLNNSAGSNRTLASSGIIDIAQGFTPAAGTTTITGSTIQYSNTAATTWNLTVFTTNVTAPARQYNNLIFNGGSTTNWSLNGLTIGVANDLTVTSGTLILGSASGAATLNVDGNYTINGANGATNLSSSNTNGGTINLLGNFVQSNGSFTKTGTSTSAFNFSKASGTQTINKTGGTFSAGTTSTSINIGTGATTNTVQLVADFAVTSGTFSPKNLATFDFQTFLLTGTSTFTTVAGTTLMTANTNTTGAFTTSGANGSIQTSGTRTYIAGTRFYFDGAADQYTGNGVGQNTVAAITINTTSSANVNLTTTVQVTGTVLLTSGVLILNTADLQLNNAATFTGSPWTTSNMIATIGSSRYSGRIIKVFPNGPQSNLTFTYPLGDLTGTVEYTPAVINDLDYTTATSPYIDFKVKDAKHPNDPSLNDYLTRYWEMLSSFPSGSGVTMQASFNYMPADVVGTEAVIKMNRYYSPTGSWTEDAGSSAGSSVLTSIVLNGAASPTPHDFDDHDIVGRLTVPLYYRSASAGPNIFELGASWIVSTDPAFLAPTGVAASTYPTYSNSAGIRIMNGHSMTVSTLAGVDDMTIESGATLTLANTMLAAFYVNNGTGTDLTVDGTIVNQSAFAWTVGGTISFSNGALYNHNVALGTVPASTWVAGSECKITGSVNSAPAGLTQSFSDFTWDCSGQLSSFSLSGTLTTIGRDLKITNTGGSSNYLGFTATTTLAMTVGRDLVVNGGYAAFATGVLPASSSLAVTRDVLVSSGAFNMARGGANPTSGITGTIGRNLDISGTGQYILSAIGATGAGALTVTVTGTTSNTSSVIGLWITGTTKSATLTCNGLFTHSGTSIHMNSVTTGTATLNANAGFTMTTGIFIVAGGASGVGVLNLADNQTFTLSGGTLSGSTSTATGTINIGTNTTSGTTTAMNISGGTLEIATAGTGIVNVYGNMNLNSGSVTQTGGSATVNFRAQGTNIGLPHLQTVTQTSATVSGTIAFNVGATGTFTNLTLGSNINLGTGSTTTVTGFTSTNASYLDFATYTLTGQNFTQQNFGIMVTAHADGFWTIATGPTTGALRTTATRALNSSGNFSYNGTVTQVTGDAVTSAYNFSIFNSTTGVTLSNNLSIVTGGTLFLNFFGLHGKLFLSTFNATLVGTATISGASSVDYIVTNSTGQLKMTVGAATSTYPVGNSAYNPMTLNNTGGTSDVYGVNVVDAVTSPAPFDGTKLINRYWVVTEAVGGGSSLAVSGQYNGGEENANFAAGTTLRIGLYTTLWSQNGATSAGGGPFVVSSSTDFTSIGTFGIGKDDGFLTAVTTYTWNGSSSSSWVTPANWTPGTSVAGPTSTDHVVINVPGTNTLNITGSRSITDFDLSGTGTFTMAASSDLTINGDFTYTSSGTPTFNCTSTLNIARTVGQTIWPFNYGNLDATGGDRTLSSTGTIGVCGTFTRGAGTYTVTGSTVDYNGSGAQTISVGTYNNLTISNARGSANLTSPSGTIAVGGVFDVSTLSAYTPVVNSASIFDFTSAGSQTVPAFYYGQLNNSGNGARTLASSGIVDINQGFTPTTGTTTITGSTVRYSNTDPVTWNLSSFTSNVGGRQYNNLEFVGGASTVWQPNASVNIGCTGTLTLSGPGTLKISNTTTSNTFTVDGNTTISNGVLQNVGSLATAGVTGTLTTNDLSVSGTGQMLMDAASNTAAATVTVNGNMSVTSTTANAINFGSGTNNASNIFNLKGNLTKSGTGTFGCSGTFNPTSGFLFNLGSGTQTINYSGTAMTSANFTASAGSTLQLASNLTLGSNATASSVTVIGTLDCQGFVIAIGNAANAFTLQATGTLQTSNASGVSASISGFTNANTSWAAGATYIFTGTSQNTGMNGYAAISSASAYTVTWLGSTSLTLDKSLTLTVFNFTNSGLVNMGNFSLSIPSSAGALTGSGFGVSKMFVTNGTGVLTRAVLSGGTGLPFTWPIGESTGSTEYSPVTLTSLATGGINGSIGFRVIDGVHPDIALATSYLSRYWPCTVSGFNATYTISTATFTYDSGTDVVVGPEASLKGNSYSATTLDWSQYASSSAGSNLLTITTGISGTTMPTGGASATYDITGRIDVPVYYRTVSGGSWSTPGIWEISSSPSFGSTFTPVNPPTTANSDSVLIRNTHTVNVNSAVAADEVFVKSGGTLNVTTSGTFTLPNGPGAQDMRVDGSMLIATPTTISASANLFVSGLIKQTVTGQITATGTLQIGASGTYEHGTASGASVIPTATWNTGSTCLLKYVGSTLPTGLGQAFSNFTVDADPGSTGAAGVLNNIGGNLTLISTAANDLILGNGTNYTINIGGNLDVQGTSGLDVQAGGGTSAINITGNLLQAAGTLITRSGSGTFVWGVTGDFIQSGGTFQLNVPSSTGTFNLRGNLTNNGAIAAPSGTRNWNFVKTTGTQTISQTGTMANAFNWSVGDGTTTTNTLQFLSNVNLGASGAPMNFTVKSGSGVDFGTYVLSGSNAGCAFVMQDNSSLITAHTAGITTAGTAAGSVQMGTRTYTGASNNNKFTYNSLVANQATGTGLPTTMNSLTINNTGGSGNNTVTCTSNNHVITTLNLTAGLLAIGTGNTMNIATGGTVNATSGDFATGATGGIVNFPGTGTWTGVSNPYSVSASGGVNFGTGPVTIQSAGVFLINSGGFVNTNPPAYSSGSTLQYNTTGTYGRGLEWSTTIGKGYPHHVLMSNNTTLNPANTGASNANVPMRCGGNLTISSGSNIYMDQGGNNMTEDLRILGNFNLQGNFSLSQAGGSDLFVGGNWTNNGSGANAFMTGVNGRQVEFNGSSAQTIGGSNGTVPAFDYVSINNSGADVTTNISLTMNQRLQMNSGKLIIGNNNITIGASGIIDLGGPTSYIVTNGTGYVSQTVNGGNDWYPVGPSTSAFGPVTLNQSGTGETINVRVINVAGLAAPSYNNAVNDTTQMVKMEWVMNESVSGSNSIRTTFGWQGSGTSGASNIEGSAFDRTTAVYHGNWNGTKYVVRATSATTGSNPYFSVCTVAQPFTGTMATNQRFVVGNINGILPCLQTAFAGDWNTASNWVDLIVPPTGSAVCINHAMTLAAAPPNPQFVTVNSPNGDITISPGITLTFEPSGTFTNNKAGFSMTTGTVAFQGGTSTVNGSQAAAFSNLQLGGNTTLTTTPTINNSLEILAGGFILSATGPNYGSSATLYYNTGGSYGRSNEWNSTSGPGFPNHVYVTGGTSLDISNGSNTARAIAGNFTVDATSSATMSSMTGNLTVPGNFNLNGSFTESSAIGGDIVLGGNWSSGALATLTHNNRDVRFNSSTATQTILTANALAFGYLTIDNSSTGVDLLTTVTAGTFRVNASRTFNLSSDKIIIATGGDVLINGTVNANTGTFEFTDGGTFTNNGTFNRGTSTVDFLGTSTGNIVGSVQTNFHNIRLAPNSGVDFNSGLLRGKVSGTFQLRAGSYVSGNAPIYEPGSKLMYSGGGTFNRNVEWDPTTVQKVEVTNNTTLKCGTNGTTFTHTMADSLIVQSGSTYDMSGPDMTAPTQVGGNVWLKGTLTLSGTAGGDLEVSGDWQNDGGTFTCNSRLTTFNGSANSSIKGSTNTNFCLLTVNKNIYKSLTATVPFTSTLAGGTLVRVQGGIFDLNGQTMSITGGSPTLRVDAGFSNGQTLKTGGTGIGSFTNYTSTGVNANTLGGKVDYSGTGAETLITPVTSYHMLWITGATTKSITQTTGVADSLWIAPSTSLDFGAAASILNAQGHVVNAGSTIGSGLGKLNLNGSSSQNVSGSGIFRNLDVNNSAGVNSIGLPTISSKLNVLSGKVNTGSDTIYLASAAQITETIGGTENYVLGNLKMYRSVGTSAETFGGMGFTLTAGSNLGVVGITRTSGTGITSTVTGLTSIKRSWRVIPTVQPALPDRDMTVSWPSEDDNARDMTVAQLWKSPDGIIPYEPLGFLQDVSATNPRVAYHTGIASFSIITVSDENNPLPLELLNFTGKNVNGVAVLNWRTLSELDLIGFEVEKSLDGKNFTSIGFVAAKGDKSAENAYGLNDPKLKVNSYYRLKLKNSNGKPEVTQTVFIKVGDLNNLEIGLIPNPAQQGAQISIHGITDWSGEASISLYGTDGRMILEVNGILADINKTFEKSVGSLASGVYSIKVTTAEDVKTLRLLKR